MIKEPESECKSAMQIQQSQGKSVPFTRRELQEPPFTQHIVEAEIH